MRTIQLAPALLCQHQELERHRQCLGPAARAFGHTLTEPHGREARPDGVARAQMLPVLRREVEEGEQGFAIFDEAGDRLLICENSATKASMPRSAWAHVSTYTTPGRR